MHTEESHRKVSEALKAKAREPGYVHSQSGLKRSKESRELMSRRKRENPPVGEKNGMFGRKHTGEAKEAMSRKHADLLVKKKVRPYGGNSKKGWYESTKTGERCFFRSSWEEATMKWLDENYQVTTWEHESVRIPYRYNENKRHYVPDFIITFSDGHREMWEIKPKEFVKSQRVLTQATAARDYCGTYGIASFEILTAEGLSDRGVL
jgi:hypothetical protein